MYNLDAAIDKISNSVDSNSYTPNQRFVLNLGLGAGWCAGMFASVSLAATVSYVTSKVFNAPNDGISLKTLPAILVTIPTICFTYDKFVKIGKRIGVVAADKLISLEKRLRSNST